MTACLRDDLVIRKEMPAFGNTYPLYMKNVKLSHDNTL